MDKIAGQARNDKGQVRNDKDQARNDKDQVRNDRQMRNGKWEQAIEGKTKKRDKYG